MEAQFKNTVTLGKRGMYLEGILWEECLAGLTFTQFHFFFSPFGRA